eukprot:6176238-Pleurochrysis_carterae.AAC.2
MEGLKKLHSTARSGLGSMAVEGDQSLPTHTGSTGAGEPRRTHSPVRAVRSSSRILVAKARDASAGFDGKHMPWSGQRARKGERAQSLRLYAWVCACCMCVCARAPDAFMCAARLFICALIACIQRMRACGRVLSFPMHAHMCVPVRVSAHVCGWSCASYTHAGRDARCVRAASLNELIYKGGQAGVTKASVTLVFDNGDREQSPHGYEHYAQIT